MSSSVAEAVTKERLHSSGEDYLKAIFILEAQHGSVRSVEVAEYMNVIVIAPQNLFQCAAL